MMDNAPMLHQESDNSPQLGGTRRIVTSCPTCGGDRLRDFFGNAVCPACIKPCTNGNHPARVRLDSDPAWFNAGTKYVGESQIIHARSGRHPMGSDLLKQEGAMCGNCKHCEGRRGVLKCWAQPHETTGGPATDIRAGWPACVLWEEYIDDGPASIHDV